MTMDDVMIMITTIRSSDMYIQLSNGNVYV